MAGQEEVWSSRSNPLPSSSSSFKPAMALDYERLHSKADESFWRKLSQLKLEVLKTDDSPIDIVGFIQPCSHPMVPEPLSVYAETLPTLSCENKLTLEISHGNRNRCPVPGILYNMNTMESFLALDKKRLLKNEAEKIWNDIWSGKAEENGNVLLRFLLIAYADLKKWKFHYMFAFPAFIIDPPVTVSHKQPASKYFSQKELESLSVAFNNWRSSHLTTDILFFLVSISSASQAAIRPLKDWENDLLSNHKLLFGFYDPCHKQGKPGWPLRNFLSFISFKWKLDKISFLCYRERLGKADLDLSLVGEALVSSPQEWRTHQYVPKTLGWEQTGGSITPKLISLAESMDPTRLAVSAADLNLKLMRWRTLPSLNLSTLNNLKCLLLGAGTLGCQVARMLMAWGIRKITLVDNGRVAMSNPLRQSLYTFDNCLGGGDLKALAAAKSLKQIFPAAETEGIALSIPMPGHPISVQETDNVLEDCKSLTNLVATHDAIFLLTDTRESRWLPTLLCAEYNKIAITAALGFDSYLVMRHGAGPFIPESVFKCEGNTVEDNMATQMEMLPTTSGNKRHRLGCYFCSDVVAPSDSTSNRTLDQQCTVTRPGLAPIASSLAVELLVGILHHPDGLNAPGELSNAAADCFDRPLGILPHQIRGSVPQFSQLTLAGYSSHGCTACSSMVVSEYRKRGMDFVMQAINHPTYLEDLTGLTELMKSANLFDVDWDDDIDVDDDM